MDALHANYSGTMGAVRCLGQPTEDVEIESLRIRISSASAALSGDTGVGVYLDSPAGGVECHIFGVHLHVQGFDSNYTANLAAGDFVSSSSCSIAAAQGATGAGIATGLTRDGIILNDSFYVTSDVHASYIEFDDAAGSYIGADKTFPDYFAFANDYTNFWLGHSGDKNIWLNYGVDADIICGSGGDTDILVYDNMAYTLLGQSATNFTLQNKSTGDVELTPGSLGLCTFTGGHDIKITLVSGDTHDLAVGDYLLHVTRTSSGECAITIPTAQNEPGRVFEVKDAGLNASLHNITVDCQNAAHTIEGSTDAYTINADGASFAFYCYDSSSWFVK